MAEQSPFLNGAENDPSPRGEMPVSPVSETGAVPNPTTPFSIRPAAPPQKVNTESETVAQDQTSSLGISGTRPQVMKGPDVGESARLATERLLAPDEDTVRKKRRRIWLGLIIFTATSVIAGLMYWWWQRPVAEEPFAEAEPTVPKTENPVPIVTEEVPPILLDDTATYRSENFKAGEIVLLGEAQFLQGDEGIAPLTIDNIRGEAFTEKNKQEVKLVITWNTNKLATAAVSYAKGIGQTPKITETDDLAYDHSIILTGLDPASTYLYTIQATDRFGNVVASEPYAVFTGARSVSLFDLIAGAIGEVFGWAVK